MTCTIALKAERGGWLLQALYQSYANLAGEHIKLCALLSIMYGCKRFRVNLYEDILHEIIHNMRVCLICMYVNGIDDKTGSNNGLSEELSFLGYTCYEVFFLSSLSLHM